MKNFEELEEFIKKNLNKNWQEKLKKKPYNLQSVKQFENHPTWWMLVYSLFESDLDNKVVKQSRGTVVEVLDDGTVNVICAPFIKFFDINDVHADKINWASKKLKCEAKIDGQLIKMFKYKGRDYWVTNGGTGLNTPIDYETEEIKDYKDLMHVALFNPFKKADKSKSWYGVLKTEDDFSIRSDWSDKIPDGCTCMFELTSPQNRIICKYSEPKLWFHGFRDAEGNEWSPEDAAEKYGIPYEIPKRYDLNNREEILAVLQQFNGLENEGFVVVDEENWTRVKMKSPSYLNMKFVRDNDTPEGIWKLVVNEQHDDILPNAPELKDKIEAQAKELNKFRKELKSTIAYAKDVFIEDKKKNRKDFALWVNEQVAPVLRPYYFKACEGEVDDIIKSAFEKMQNAKKGYDELYIPLRNAMNIKA